MDALRSYRARRYTRDVVRCGGLAILFATHADALSAQPHSAPAGALERSFLAPPDAAKPRVWWHWMNANVTIPGIDADFAWMKRIGIAGVQNFDASLSTPRLVATPLPYMTDAWKVAFRHAVTRADALGLEYTIASSPGWSETGGPWVKPAQAMKKLVWSERVVDGGRPVAGPLPAPPSVAGPFQDLAAAPSAAFGAGGKPAPPPVLYHDIAAVAYRIPDAERDATPVITASSTIDGNALVDGDRVHSVELPFAADSTAWVQFAYEQPQTIRAITWVAGASARTPQLQASDDGTRFRPIGDLVRGRAAQSTTTIPPTTARYFRVVFQQSPAPAGSAPTRVRGQQIAELSLTGAARVNRFEDKAGWSTAPELESVPTPDAPANAVVRRSDVIDVTARLKSDGTLDWTPPAGRWRLIRLGWSLIGTTNRPASPEATGLEVDKLSRNHVRAYLDDYLASYKSAVGAGMMGKRGIRYMLTDSYEGGSANWTDAMTAEFTRRRGYDPRPWFPALVGYVVDNAEASDGFLWDFRRTLGDLISDNHYSELSRGVHERGMGRYGESHEVRRAFIGDGMEVKKTADIPMGATWYGRINGPGDMLPDIRESAAVAHLYGQNLVAAESFTVSGNTYAIAPEMLKPMADRMMANGLNRFVIHTSVHQPLDSIGPGLSLGRFGEWFTRKETWAEQAGPWIEYLARSSQMLQQGRFAADVAWFYGEDDNITSLYANRMPVVPAGYAWDFINGDAVRNLLTVKNGRLVTPSGMSYRVLALDPVSPRMTLATLRRLRDLVRAGAVVAGTRPPASPSLADNAAEFTRIADALWSEKGGAGRVYPTVEAAVSALQIAPDVDMGSDTSIAVVHRTLRDGEVYFVANLGDAPVSSDLGFRVAGKAPELWRADDGSITPASYRTAGGHTVVPVSLLGHDAVFVVFRKRATASSRVVAEPVTTTVATLTAPWTVKFPADRGAPGSITLRDLASWTDNANDGVKYFSGTASYVTTLDVSPAWREGDARLLLDLGSVKNVAEVLVNGRSAGIAWKAPFRVDVTDLARTGANTVEVKVSNLWPNRLIGDKQPNVARTYAFAVNDPFTATSPLLASGLLGPVRVIRRSH
ncbi:MAG: discoidin domain-containing protein [Gemmatimonadota bacterium]|nr:discoidin domain-containing protein [Gemmatimonadota bacterium]